LQPGEYHVYTNVNAALPVTIVNFTGKKENNGNLLTWQVANELNLSHYELEKSIDGQNFSFLAKINADGKSNYSYTDDVSSFSGVTFYRLKRVDIDGHLNYSGIIKIQSITNSWLVTVNPNPVVKNLKVNIESPVQDKGTLIIYDLSGRSITKTKYSNSSRK